MTENTTEEPTQRPNWFQRRQIKKLIKKSKEIIQKINLRVETEVGYRKKLEDKILELDEYIEMEINCPYRQTRGKECLESGIEGFIKRFYQQDNEQARMQTNKQALQYIQYMCQAYKLKTREYINLYLGQIKD